MSDRVPRWVITFVPVAALSVLPLVGLVYAATASLGGAGPEPSASADTDPSGSSASGGGRKRSRAGKSKSPRSDDAKLCCEKLMDLAQSAEIEKRPTFLTAAKACESASDDDEAIKVVASTLGGERVEIPPECSKD